MLRHIEDKMCAKHSSVSCICNVGKFRKSPFIPNFVRSTRVLYRNTGYGSMIMYLAVAFHLYLAVDPLLFWRKHVRHLQSYGKDIPSTWRGTVPFSAIVSSPAAFSMLTWSPHLLQLVNLFTPDGHCHFQNVSKSPGYFHPCLYKEEYRTRWKRLCSVPSSRLTPTTMKLQLYIYTSLVYSDTVTGIQKILIYPRT